MAPYWGAWRCETRQSPSFLRESIGHTVVVSGSRTGSSTGSTWSATEVMRILNRSVIK
jgi:hypothetical protein